MKLTELYKHSIDLNEVEDERIQNSAWYKAMQFKQGLPVRVVKYTPSLQELEPEWVRAWNIKHPWSLIVPLEGLSKYFSGFLFRSTRDKFFLLWKTTQVVAYGFSNLVEFQYGNTLILVEGAKDAEAIRRVHPYVLGYLGSRPSINLLNFCKQLTNKILLIPDNDKPRKQMERFAQYNALGLFYSAANDFGVYFDHGDEMDLNFLKVFLESSHAS